MDAFIDKLDFKKLDFNGTVHHSGEKLMFQMSVVGEDSRVGKGISAQAAPRTVREGLPSYGSCYPIMLLFLSSNDKTTVGFRLVSIDISYTISSCRISYMCSSSTFGLVHSNNKIRHVLHLC
jgi:hypothetical protein